MQGADNDSANELSRALPCPLRFQIGVFPHADGSAYYEQGNTQCVCRRHTFCALVTSAIIAHDVLLLLLLLRVAAGYSSQLQDPTNQATGATKSMIWL